MSTETSSPPARTDEGLNEIRDQLMHAAAQMDGVTHVEASDAAVGVFHIDYADGTGAVVDLWHA